jgi:hypothetical protein
MVTRGGRRRRKVKWKIPGRHAGVAEATIGGRGRRRVKWKVPDLHAAHWPNN